jgi:CHRD domain-containing protein
MSKYQIALIASAAIAALTIAPANAEEKKYIAEMTATAQVPPVESDATGSAELTVDTDAHTISWKVAVEGLSGEPTKEHIHGPATATENAPPEIDMSNAIMEGSAPITDAQLADIEAGRTYVNVHTAKFPDGEIRGQVEPAM